MWDLCRLVDVIDAWLGKDSLELAACGLTLSPPLRSTPLPSQLRTTGQEPCVPLAAAWLRSLSWHCLVLPHLLVRKTREKHQL